MGIEGKLFGKGLIGDIKPTGRGPLARRFLFPPFSVWNTRDGHWQSRRRAWLRLGIKSETGRENTKIINTADLEKSKGKIPLSKTSIFDPVVCELVYRWWCKPGDIVIDPFAGGSVRGIIASIMGLRYWGCDLSKNQIIANYEQVNESTTGRHRPIWVSGDSYHKIRKAPIANLIFSCPPYGNLEKYSNNSADLSNMDYPVFITNYTKIIRRACERLHPNRFACFVVGNFRNKKTGQMHDFVGDTIRIFEDIGLNYYNDIVLINYPGTGSLRAVPTFIRGSQKVVKVHQNILVFIKGNPKKAARRIQAEEGKINVN